MVMWKNLRWFKEAQRVDKRNNAEIDIRILIMCQNDAIV